MSIDCETVLQLLKLYYKNDESGTATLRAYKNMNKLHSDPFSAQTITCMMQKFERTKSLHKILSPGRPSLQSQVKDEVVYSL